MSMAGRFTAILLAILGVVLIGFSAALYVAVRSHLYRQLDERLGGALAVLAAAAEIHPDSVEWEPQERVMPLGQDSNREQLRWMVCDGRGRRVDHSRNLDTADLTVSWTPAPSASGLPALLKDRRGRVWRLAQRRILPSAAPQTGSRVASNRREERGAAARGVMGYDLPADRYPELVLITCAQTAPTEATLSELGWTLTGLVAAAWLFNAALCSRFAKRALAPLTRMAESAAALNASNAGWSLDLPGSGDELDHLGRTINDLLARLHLAYERQRRFSGDASHQLRTPLTVMIGQLEVTLRQKRSDEEYQRALKSALGQAIHLSQIVEALLFLVRAKGEAFVPAGEPMDLGKWTADQVSERSPAVIHRNAPADPLFVNAHSPLLAQVLDNLLDNAFKYGRAGGTVVVSTYRDGPDAVLAVEDDGPGIPPDETDRVFEPFFRSKQVHRIAVVGVGLGLSVAQRIAVALGGSVRARNATGRGCRIEVHLPALELASEPKRPPSSPIGADGR